MKTATTSSRINDLIGWVKKNNLAARAARFLVQLFDVVYQSTKWNFHFWGSDDNVALSSKPFILCFCMHTIRVKQAKVHFAYCISYNVTSLE